MAFELIRDEPGVEYLGKAEKCVYTFSTLPDEIPGESWLADQIIQQQIEELAKQDSQLLHIRVWRDTSPVWQTDYMVEVYASASPLFWGVMVLGVLAILILVLTWKIIEVVKDIDWGGVPPAVQWAIPIIAVVAGLVVLLLLKRRKT